MTTQEGSTDGDGQDPDIAEKPSRQVGQAGLQSRTARALAFDAPRISHIIDTMAAGDDELAVDHVRQVAPGAKVVVYSGHEPHAAKQFVRGEPDLYLRKGDEPEHLIDALRELGD